MRNLMAVLALGGSAAFLPQVGGCGATGSTTQEAVAASHVATFDVQGMTCASCSVTVRTALSKLDGIATVEVDVDGGSATVTFDGAAVSAEQIADAISGSGYKASVRTAGKV